MGGVKSKPQVTIKLLEKPKDTEYHAYPESRLITVTRSFYPAGSTQDFYRYTHGWDGTKYRLAEIQDDSSGKINVTSQLKGVSDVTSVSAYYWASDTSKALIVGITKKSGGNNTTYYTKNVGGHPPWHTLFGTSYSEPLDDESLEQTLDELNCYFNNGITIDLSYSKSKSGGNYCCHKHENKKNKKGGRISVEEKTVCCQTHSGSATFFKHEFTSGHGVQLAAIKYNDTGRRRRINIDGLGLPIKQSGKVSVFYSDSKDPVLIYVESTGRQDVTGWYKKDLSKGDDKLWTRVDAPIDITPDKLASPIDCNSEGFKKLIGVLKQLKCEGLQQCTMDPEHLGQDGVQREEVQKTAEQQTQQEEQERDRPQQQQTGSKPFSGPSAGAKAGISIASVGGVGIAAVTIWKWPKMMSFLIARM
ncbi:hypothetical protein BEWA_029160 [Theileria equi strain WA]|uniref:Uncharacterized protein n=1 Tax=Theileria equi strain WA TaxID=1537102 RepID=L0AYH4_THEEQ|nr:hypothetical protein BEWA_029160 [Theileria equi strain WA]AFZ80066.1 hypothetical protein BEWA_029160 [Theileria equi strain WA]|eukprot:XP_004829732.1 hypothetical protein BEWA_029160 [Theileria equi strain WA]